jgi:hypothetical protein
MKKIIVTILIVFALFAAYKSKPDDKTCIITAVKAVWGNRVPPETKPIYFEQFMNLTSQSVKVNDWIFLKRIQYKIKDDYVTVGYGAFKRVFIL